MWLSCIGQVNRAVRENVTNESKREKGLMVVVNTSNAPEGDVNKKIYQEKLRVSTINTPF